MDRLPSYPLFTIDPFFSLWSPADKLAEHDTAFWTGAQKRAYGLIQADGVTYRFMGNAFGTPLTQTDVSVRMLSTRYSFTCDAFDAEVVFLSPRDPRDTHLVGMPTAFVDVTITPKKEIKSLTTAVVFDEDICYDVERGVKNFVVEGQGYRAAGIGLSRQMLLSNSLDNTSADWGYVYLASDEAYALGESGVKAFAAGKPLCDDGKPERRYIAAAAKGVKARIAVAFDDVASINYFGKILRGQYLTHHTVFDAISETLDTAEKLYKTEADLEEELNEYILNDPYQFRLLAASLRQSVAAHKLVEDDGRLLFISKECFSNGCAATVDVSYPSSPLYLLFNPDLLWGMLEPIFDFASMPVWKYDFAPHDVGTYPLCTGQVYGLNEKAVKLDAAYGDPPRWTHVPFYSFPAENDLYEFTYQMPVEECSNMLIMAAGAERSAMSDRDEKMTPARWALLEKWVGYIIEHGLIPENQLCTDDFAGHLDKNANLSVKAIVAIGAYAALLKDFGKKEESKKYRAIAEDYAAKWVEICYRDGRKYAPLTMDGQGAYSLKYNLLFDKLLALNLFPESVYRAEFDAAIRYAKKYGAPLDERKTYTKSDWLMWMAALGEDNDERKPIFQALERYLTETPSRVPFSDWYDTETGAFVGFVNRTVQGGMFAVALAELRLLSR